MNQAIWLLLRLIYTSASASCGSYKHLSLNMWPTPLWELYLLPCCLCVLMPKFCLWDLYNTAVSYFPLNVHVPLFPGCWDLSLSFMCAIDIVLSPASQCILTVSHYAYMSLTTASGYSLQSFSSSSLRCSWRLLSWLSKRAFLSSSRTWPSSWFTSALRWRPASSSILKLFSCL